MNPLQMYLSPRDAATMGAFLNNAVDAASNRTRRCDIDTFKAANLVKADTKALVTACKTNPCSPECRKLCSPFRHCATCQACMLMKWDVALQAGQHCAGYAPFCGRALSCNKHVEIKSGLPGRVAVFDGKGKDLTPCELDSTLLDKHVSKAKELPLCHAPHFYIDAPSVQSLGRCMATPHKCDPKKHIGNMLAEDSCALCNGQHCKCAPSKADAVKSVLTNFAHNKRIKASIGKEVWDQHQPQH